MKRVLQGADSLDFVLCHDMAFIITDRAKHQYKKKTRENMTRNNAIMGLDNAVTESFDAMNIYFSLTASRNSLQQM